jgi:pyrroline-5-carboxylate reductase
VLEDKFGIKTFENNLEVVDKCDNIIVSVKPHMMGPVLDELKHSITD